MPKAVITFDDDQAGGVGMSLFLEGGFTQDSPAHNAAAMLVNYMRDQAGDPKDEQTRILTGNEATWIQGDVVAIPGEDNTQARVANLAHLAGKTLN